MNSIAKITIPIEKLYQTINSAEVLSAQQLIERNSYEGEAYPIENVMHYTAASNAIAEVSKAIKAIQDARKMVTGPLDAYKKELMRIEGDATMPLQSFIASTKNAMLKYTQECEKQFAVEQHDIGSLIFECLQTFLRRCCRSNGPNLSLLEMFHEHDLNERIIVDHEQPVHVVLRAEFEV